MTNTQCNKLAVVYAAVDRRNIGKSHGGIFVKDKVIVRDGDLFFKARVFDMIEDLYGRRFFVCDLGNEDFVEYPVNSKLILGHVSKDFKNKAHCRTSGIGKDRLHLWLENEDTEVVKYKEETVLPVESMEEVDVACQEKDLPTPVTQSKAPVVDKSAVIVVDDEDWEDELDATPSTPVDKGPVEGVVSDKNDDISSDSICVDNFVLPEKSFVVGDKAIIFSNGLYLKATVVSTDGRNIEFYTHIDTTVFYLNNSIFISGIITKEPYLSRTPRKNGVLEDKVRLFIGTTDFVHHVSGCTPKKTFKKMGSVVHPRTTSVQAECPVDEQAVAQKVAGSKVEGIAVPDFDAMSLKNGDTAVVRVNGIETVGTILSRDEKSRRFVVNLDNGADAVVQSDAVVAVLKDCHASIIGGHQEATSAAGCADVSTIKKALNSLVDSLDTLDDENPSSHDHAIHDTSTLLSQIHRPSV